MFEREFSYVFPFLIITNRGPFLGNRYLYGLTRWIIGLSCILILLHNDVGEDDMGNIRLKIVEGLVATKTKEKNLLKRFFVRKRKIDNSVLLVQSSGEMGCSAKQSHAVYFSNKTSYPCCGACSPINPLHNLSTEEK